MKLKELDEKIARFQGDCNHIALNALEEGSFTWQGCDICKSGGDTVYKVLGYNPKTKEVVDLGEICSSCLAYIYNGEIPEGVEKD
jgi:hypothetical protein